MTDKPNTTKRGRPSREEQARVLYSFKQAFLNDTSELFKEIDGTLSLYGLTRKALLHSCRHIEKVATLEKRLQDVILALEYYRDETPLKGSKKLEAIISLYREKVSKIGFEAFNTLSERIIPIVYLFGDTKDRTSLSFSLHFDMEKVALREPILSREYANEIRARIIQDGEEAQKNFQNCIIIYETLRINKPVILNAINDYVKTGRQAALFISIYRTIERIDYYSADVAALVPKAKRGELEPLDGFNFDFLKSLCNFPYEVENIDELKSRCRDELSRLSHIAEQKLSRVKGTIIAFEHWIDKYKAWEIIPIEIRELLQTPELNSVLEHIPAEYKREYIANRIKNGEPVQNFMQEIALYPSYEDTIADKETAINITNRINDTFSDYTRLHGV